MPPPRDDYQYKLTFDWNGRYESDARFAAEWTKAANPYSRTCSLNKSKVCKRCIDDKYKYKYVMFARTILISTVPKYYKSGDVLVEAGTDRRISCTVLAQCTSFTYVGTVDGNRSSRKTV